MNHRENGNRLLKKLGVQPNATRRKAAAALSAALAVDDHEQARAKAQELFDAVLEEFQATLRPAADPTPSGGGTLAIAIGATAGGVAPPVARTMHGAHPGYYAESHGCFQTTATEPGPRPVVSDRTQAARAFVEMLKPLLSLFASCGEEVTPDEFANWLAKGPAARDPRPEPTEETTVYVGPTIRCKANQEGELFFDVPDMLPGKNGAKGGRPREWSQLEEMIRAHPDTPAKELAAAYCTRFPKRKKPTARVVRNVKAAMKRRGELPHMDSPPR